MPSSSIKERKFTLPESGSSSRIADLNSDLAVIVTHPWGPLGGRGDRQVDQVREAANFLLAGQHLDTKTSSSAAKTKSTNVSTEKKLKAPNFILLVGYSYGSIISASASAIIPQCIGIVMISPPLAVRHWLYMFKGDHHLEQARKRNLPLLMMIGSNDNFTSENAFMDIVHTMPQNTTTGAVLKEADHFFRGREKDLMDIMGHWILNVFQQCNGDLSLLSSVDFSSFGSLAIDSHKSFESCTGCL